MLSELTRYIFTSLTIQTNTNKKPNSLSTWTGSGATLSLN